MTAYNYDFVFKDSFNLFKNDIADFLGVELPGIASYLETEFFEIEISAERMDLNFKLEDGKEKMKELREKIEKGEEINYLELIFLPLMNSDQDMVKRVKETIELEDKLNADQKFKNNLAALTIVLCDKFLSSGNMIELWRDLKMVKFFKYVEEQGKKEGEKQGERKLLKKQIKSKFELEKLDEELNTLIDEADIEKIEEVAEIFYKLADIEKLKTILNNT